MQLYTYGSVRNQIASIIVYRLRTNLYSISKIYCPAVGIVLKETVEIPINTCIVFNLLSGGFYVDDICRVTYQFLTEYLCVDALCIIPLRTKSVLGRIQSVRPQNS